MCGNLLIAQWVWQLHVKIVAFVKLPKWQSADFCQLPSSAAGCSLKLVDELYASWTPIHHSSWSFILQFWRHRTFWQKAKRNVWMASRQEVIKLPLVGEIVYYNHKTTLSLTSHSGESKSFITFHQLSTGTQSWVFFVFFAIHIWQVEGKYLPYR